MERKEGYFDGKGGRKEISAGGMIFSVLYVKLENPEKPIIMSLGSLVGQNYRNTHNKQHTQLLEIVRLPVAMETITGNSMSAEDQF